MTAIWLLSSRGRPREAQETIDACMDAGMTSPGVLYVDETVDEYRGIRLPPNWTIHYERQWGSLQASMSWCFRRYPHASQYGWLADDTRPQTPGWDKVLEAVAGDWCLSYARDMWLSERPHTLEPLKDGSDLSSGLCWGGELVRSVGWWALPGVRQAFIDVAWCRLLAPLGLCRYVHEAVVEHLNYRTGKREMDAVDDWSRGGDNYIERDIRYGQQWLTTPEFTALVRRLKAATADVPCSEHQVERAVQSLRDQYVEAHSTPGQKAAKTIRLLEEFDQSGKGAELAEQLKRGGRPTV